MKILITGGAGFIARNLSEQLSAENEVVSLNSSQLNLLDSVNVFNYLKISQFDVVIHSATYDAAPKTSTKDPAKVLENNLKMFFNLTRCREYFDRMIYFGSGAEFGRENWVSKMKEDYFDQHVPSDPYGYSKYIMTKYTQLNRDIYNLRLFGVFGKYEDWRYRFISNACSRAVLNMPITIHQNNLFDYLYIDDLAKIVEWFLKNKPKENVYNICTGKVYELKDLADKIIKISGKNLEMQIKPAGKYREYSGDNSLIFNEMTGFKFSTMDDSLRDLYGWYDANKNILEKNHMIQ